MTAALFEEWRTYLRASPYNWELGLRFSSLHESGCVLCLPYRADLVGDPTTGVLHVGAIVALVDTTLGYSLFRKIREERGFATLDLRIDHLKQSVRGQDLFCSGDCYRVTDELAFIRGSVYHQTPADPVATAVSVFMFTAGPLAMSTSGARHDPA